jgi:DNA mismatch endonuclease, patch repair protein
MLRRALWRQGLRYRLHPADLPGKPDIVVRGKRVAIFCDGDFWHGRNWRRRKARLQRGANSEYWVAKISRNRRRAKEVTGMLRDAGWLVIRIWESTIKRDPERVAIRVMASIAKRG